MNSTHTGVRLFGSIRGLVKRMLLSPNFPDSMFVIAANARFALRRSQTRFSVAGKNLYVAQEGNSRRFFDSRERGHSLYQHGLSERFSRIYSSFLLDEVVLDSSHIVINCGANYGDLWGRLSNYVRLENYFAFEQSSREFTLLEQNVSSLAVCEQKALGNHSGSVALYVSSGQGDSSLIEPPTYESTEICTITTLDEYCSNRGITQIRLLKIEAEGGEIEVIEGATRMLQLTDYVCFDGSPERGKSKKSTFAEVANALFASGFHCLGVNFCWHRAIVQNSALSAD